MAEDQKISENQQTATHQEDPSATGASPDSLEQQHAELQARHAELEAKHAEVSDAYLRARAETENIRRRAEEEQSKIRKFAIESFAESLLPVHDSLEAALNAPNQTFESLRAGVETTLKQLDAAFERNKLKAVVPGKGEKLDPNVHQTISAVPAEQEPNTVVDVLQKGYVISDRTLRPALVTVAAHK